MSAADVTSPIEPRPQVAAAAPYVFPTPTTHELPNGVVLKAFHLPGQYVVSVRLALPLRLDLEPRELEGITSVMSRLLDEGTAQHTPEEFAELLERTGAVIGASVNDRGVSVDLDVPTSRLDAALDLLRQALAEPRFPETEVRRIVRSRLAEIEQERASAPQRAGRELISTFYDARERASRPAAGREETVSVITPQALRDFHARHLTPAGATVVVAGDLTGHDVPDVLARTLGAWRPRPQAVPERSTEPPRLAADRARIVVVDRPGSVQSELSIAAPGPDRHVTLSRGAGVGAGTEDDRDGENTGEDSDERTDALAVGWAAYPVLGYVIGGSPTARIDAVLREDKGFTYGIRSGFRPRGSGGLFVTSGSVRSEVTAEALGLVLDILDRAHEGFTEDEVRAGVDFIVGAAAGRFATADAIADEASSRAMDGLPDDFTTRSLDTMRRLTTSDLAHAYSAYVRGGWTAVVVGDAESIVEPIRALGRGDVSVIPA